MFGPTKPIAFPSTTSVTAQQLQSLKTASGQPRQGSQSPNPVVRGGSQTFPQHVSGVTAILRKSSDVSTKATITFQRPVNDGLYVDSSVYVSGYQGNPQPVKIASGQSPISVALNNTGESLAFTVQANGPTGSAPLSSAPTTTSKLVSTPLATVPTTGGTGAGVTPYTSPANQWINAVLAGGYTSTQPAFSNISGHLTNSQLPIAGAYQWVTLVADSTTDNHAVLAAALAAVPANGGTIYLVPVGTGTCFVSASLSVTTNNTVIIGSGWGTTSLLSDQGACTLQFAAGQAGIVVNGAKCVVIENLCVLSKDTGATAGDNGIWFKGQSGLFVLRNVSVQKFGNIGILIDSTSSGNIDQWRIDQCFVYENFSDGFQILGGTDGNVGIATGLNCTANGGWGMNLDSGAGANVFIIPQITGNAGGGIRVNQSNNSFYDVYMESTAVSSFVITASGNNNYVKFHNFGQPTTITNSGGASNVFIYHDSNGFVGFSSLNVCNQSFAAARTYKLNNGVFNANDFSITDDLGVTWLNINQSSSTIWALKTLAAANLAGATLAGGSTNSGILEWLSNYWNPTSLSGTVNTSSTGNAVTWVSGSVFTAAMVGKTIVINGTSYTVATFVSSTSITLSTSPGNQAGVAYAFGASINDFWTAQTIGGSGANGASTLTFSHTGTSGSAAVQINAGLLVQAATPAGGASQLGIGTTVGFGNGTPATPVTTTALGTGTGPATPQTIVNYLQVTIGGTVYYLPLVQ